MLKREIFFLCFLILFSLFGIYQTSLLPDSIHTGIPGSGFLPNLCFVVMALTCLLLLFGKLWERRQQRAEIKSDSANEAKKSIFEGKKVFFGVLGGLLGYIFFLTRLGFFIPTFIYLSLMMLALNYFKKKWALLKAIVSAGVITLSIYLIFVEFFSVTLPQARWF